MNNIKLKSVGNARDLGGIRVSGGKIKEKKLIRGSHLGLLSDRDAETLVFDYALQVVIDLRNSAEKSELPDAGMAGVKYIEMPLFDASVPGMSHESKQDIDNIPDMRLLYRYVMHSSECLNNIAAVLQKILRYDGDGAIYYHCTEGKDRTGIITALLLLLLGADKKDIISDYLFTNTVNLKKARKYRFLLKYIKFNKKAADLAYGVFIASEKYLNEVFGAVEEVGFEKFKTDILKINSDDLERFRQRVVAKAAD